MIHSLLRRYLGGAILGLCLLVMVHVWLLEAFVVPTASMAPTLAGHHRSGECPCCGFTVRVGRHAEDTDGSGDCFYRHTTCSNCGFSPMPLEHVPEATGDHILVNKSVYLFRRPRRWEVIVFRLFGKIFVKRVVGLPGECLTIVDGDLIADDRLVRKSLEEFKSLRILVFDNEFLPPDGGPYRWEHHAEPDAPARLSPLPSGERGRGEGIQRVASDKAPSPPALPQGEEGRCGLAPAWRAAKCLRLDGANDGQAHWLTYRNFSMSTGKDEPLRDEYADNDGSPHGQESVHDFMMECDLEIVRGNGSVSLGISDGKDTLVVKLSTGPEGMASLYRQRGGELPPRPIRDSAVVHQRAELQPGRRHRLELAFVDRRVTMRLDGTDVFPLVDLPAAGKRRAVDRPISLGVAGVTAAFDNVRLYRDVHYTQAGRHAVHGKVVRLGPEQYFVMGDNSPNSEDSRFWSNHGAVPETDIIGHAFLVHFPSRIATGARWGRSWQCQVPDWSRMRSLR